MIAKRLSIKLAFMDHFGSFDYAVRRLLDVRGRGPGCRCRVQTFSWSDRCAVPHRGVAEATSASMSRRTARFALVPPFGLSVAEKLWAGCAPSQTRCRHARYDRRLTLITEVLPNRAG